MTIQTFCFTDIILTAVCPYIIFINVRFFSIVLAGVQIKFLHPQFYTFKKNNNNHK